MEPKEIEALLVKYYNTETNLEEEKIVKEYYKDNDIFNFYHKEKEIVLKKEHKIPITEKKFNWKISVIAASFVIGMIFVTFIMGENKSIKNDNLGTINNPEEAYLETVKALELVSIELNKGIAKAQYLNDYENTKKLIFK